MCVAYACLLVFQYPLNMFHDDDVPTCPMQYIYTYSDITYSNNTPIPITIPIELTYSNNFPTIFYQCFNNIIVS